MKYKWLDNLTVLELVNLLTVGISSYNLRGHVPSDVPVHNGFVKAENLLTQQHIEKISQWTKNKQMKLNTKKSCAIFLNFTEKYQFTSRLVIEGAPLKIVYETKLLGVILTSDLKWSKNTESLIKRANARMELLRRLSSFRVPVKTMVHVYILYIRSILEQSSVIWHSTLTEENNADLERVQKNALRNILKENYTTYEEALKSLNIDTLYERREKLMLTFGKKCLNLEQTKYLFPPSRKTHCMETRHKEKYEVCHSNTERLKNSTVPYIQRMLNKKPP